MINHPVELTGTLQYLRAIQPYYLKILSYKKKNSGVNHHQQLLGNWNILTLTGKELELVEEAKWYHLDIIGVSSTKRRGSGTVDLDGGWKLFYAGADPSMSAQAV